METIQSYKCPCCGAALAYDGYSDSLHCSSCGNDFSVENLRRLSEAESETSGGSVYNWEEYTPREFGEAEDIDLSGYSCPSCGAEVSGDGNLGACVCPYCGNAVIIKKQFDGALRPDLVIPFRLDKTAAIQKFEESCSKAPFLPNLFKDKKRIAEMSGIYVPFWLFDCDCHAHILYDAKYITTWSDSDYDYTKTDYYRLSRAGSVSFNNIPVDGSKKADNAYMEAVEPFDCSAAKEFNPAYLSGFLADKYDVTAAECTGRANERVKNSTEKVFASTTSGYSSVHPVQSNINFENGKVRYSLLPVWMLNIKYLDKMYNFAINGQTGKVVGEYPVDKRKKWMYFAKAFGITLAVCSAIGYTILKFL